MSASVGTMARDGKFTFPILLNFLFVWDVSITKTNNIRHIISQICDLSCDQFITVVI